MAEEIPLSDKSFLEDEPQEDLTTTMKKGNKILLGFFIVLLVAVVSLFIYQEYRYNAFYFTYNGFEVHKVVDNGVQYKINFILTDNPQPYIVNVRNDPRALEAISLDPAVLSQVLKRHLFITIEENATGVTVVAALEISKITGNPLLFNIPTEGAVVANPLDIDVPVKTCADVTAQQGIIYLKQGNENRIYQENGCVIIEGVDEYALIEGADRLSLTLLGIMNP